MRVIGTAGHVDHGKSTLIEALTGVHPDRLKEERVREMTIDLGFGWMDLAGETVGIIDVPGHRDFIENMLAGVGGIDAALFVVAADEGVMPQTREHLTILDLLKIQGGVIALTKIDLVEDPDWLELVEGEIRETVRGTVLSQAPIVRVSAKNRLGLDELRHHLQLVLAGRPARPDFGRPRLPVDRVFSMPGFGTVVTGTLIDGSFRIGDEVEILPGNRTGRIRGLQSHNQTQETAYPGRRTAINLAGVDQDEIARGQVIVRPGSYTASQRLDLSFELLPGTNSSLKHNSEVKFYLGTAETLGRVRLLGVGEILAGQEGWIQLELSRPVVAVRGDRFILRRPSPAETLGGGEVIDAHPDRRYKRFNPQTLQRLDELKTGSPGSILYQAFQTPAPTLFKEALAKARLDPAAAEQALRALVEGGQVIPLHPWMGKSESNGYYLTEVTWRLFLEKTTAILAAYHRQYPLRKGMPREEFKSRSGIPAKPFNALVHKFVETHTLIDDGTTVAMIGHKVIRSPEEDRLSTRLLERFQQEPFSPPPVSECQAEVGDELLAAMLEAGEVVQVSKDILFRKEDYETLCAWVADHLQANGTLAVAQFRDRFSTSRRYALAFLEHLDQVGLTVRDGETRRLRKREGVEKP